jgi:hypothetical protein
MKAKTAGLLMAAVLVATAASAGAPSFYLGPAPYLEASDSPFPLDEFGFCLETFENGVLDVPGVFSATSVVINPGGTTDSVDGDDGTLDGSGQQGRSFFRPNGNFGMSFNFPGDRVNGFPTRVGIVWTDGGFSAPVSFEAFDEFGASLGKHGPFDHADNSNSGTTDEDRFYGVQYPQGIFGITISNSSGGIEVDHLQLDRCVLCGDANSDLRLTSPDALRALRTAVGTDTCPACVCDVNQVGGVSSTDALTILRKAVGLTPAMNCGSCDFRPLT